VNCEQVREDLADYLGGELSTSGAAALEAHLQGCASCRREVDELRRTIDVLRGLETVGADEASARTSDLMVVRRRPFAWRAAAALLRAAAMIALGAWIGWSVAGRGRDTAPSPAVRGDGRQVATNADPSVTPDAPGLPLMSGIHPAWFRQAQRNPGASSSFARQLAMLAPSDRP
jgi:anti-sigma factor RsiW